MGHTCWSFGRVRVNSPYPKKFNSACKRGCSAPHCYWSQSSVGEQHDGQVLKILQAFETYLNDHFGACRPRFWRLPDHIVGSCWCHIPRYLGKLYKHLSYMQFHGQFIIIFPGKSYRQGAFLLLDCVGKELGTGFRMTPKRARDEWRGREPCLFAIDEMCPDLSLSENGRFTTCSVIFGHFWSFFWGE